MPRGLYSKWFFALAVALLAGMFTRAAVLPARAEESLEDSWNSPPNEARLRAYWWWLNGNVTRESISHDLQEMKAKGFGGVVLIDAGGANQDGNDPVPHGPTFFTPEWRELYKYALKMAAQLGMEVSLTIQSGWNLGGPIVTPDDAAKQYVWSETNFDGGQEIEIRLPTPKFREKYYRDTFVLAYPLTPGEKSSTPLENWKQKALQEPIGGFSAPSSACLFAEIPATPGEEDTRTNVVVDLTKYLGTNGVLHWNAPPGRWRILRFGCTIGNHSHVSTCSDGWKGYSLDVFDSGAFDRYWGAIVEPLIADAGPLTGSTLKYLYTDSWEIELANWTPSLREEFEKRRGYDLLPWLPTLTGRIVNSRDESDRFLADYRKTLGDLAIDHHYRLWRDKARAHGLMIHPESGGPHPAAMDAQRCLGWDDAPMAEFWAWSPVHRVGDDNRFFVKQPASAAHTYGHKLVLAEGFTDMGQQWQESLWSNLKPAFDKALCEGMNRLVWHAFVCSPKETGIPGQQYFAGTHLNPKVTWWPMSQPFFSYIDRCQAMMQQGKPVADVLYYYGDHVPNFAQLKSSDPAKVLPGYDYDVITEEALVERASARDGQIVLPDGVSYRLLVLPDRNIISLAALKKVAELQAAGATIIGPKPVESSSLNDYPACDAELKSLTDKLWSNGQIITNKTAREVLLARGIPPDFEWSVADKAPSNPEVDYIHRTADGAEIYFVANRSSNSVTLNCTFRVDGLAPEFWEPVSGGRHFAATYQVTGGRTTVPIHFDPCGSVFVVFREPADKHPASASSNWTEIATISELTGPWQVHFDPRWGGPAHISFDTLQDWTTRAEPGVKYYSGKAVYRKSFVLEKPVHGRILVDLGSVRELAQVRVNGHGCGITWTPPFRADITEAVTVGKNTLEVEVVNFWPNRIIGDQVLDSKPPFTKTNIRQLKKTTPLVESGLLGPVRILSENQQ